MEDDTVLRVWLFDSRIVRRVRCARYRMRILDRLETAEDRTDIRKDIKSFDPQEQ